MKTTLKNFKVDEAAHGMLISCDGEFTFKNSVEIRTVLGQSAVRSSNEVLCLKNATAIDITGIQIASAWKRTLVAQGRVAEVVLPESHDLHDLLLKTGSAKLF